MMGEGRRKLLTTLLSWSITALTLLPVFFLDAKSSETMNALVLTGIALNVPLCGWIAYERGRNVALFLLAGALFSAFARFLLFAVPLLGYTEKRYAELGFDKVFDDPA